MAVTFKRKLTLDDLTLNTKKDELLVIIYSQRSTIAELRQQVRKLHRENLKLIRTQEAQAQTP